MISRMKRFETKVKQNQAKSEEGKTATHSPANVYCTRTAIWFRVLK